MSARLVGRRVCRLHPQARTRYYYRSSRKELIRNFYRAVQITSGIEPQIENQSLHPLRFKLIQHLIKVGRCSLRKIRQTHISDFVLLIYNVPPFAVGPRPSSKCRHRNLRTGQRNILSLFLSGFYRNASRLPIYHQIRLTLRGVLLSGVFILSLLFLIRGLIYSRLFLLLFWAALLPAMTLERFWLYKLNLRALERGYGRKRTWIYGEDTKSQELYERFLETPELGCEVVGFLSEREQNRGGDYGGLPVFQAAPQDLKPIVQREGIEQILVPGLIPTSIPSLKNLMAFALEHDLDLRLVHPRSDFLATQTRLFDVLGVSLVGKRSPLTRPLAQAWKRTFDFLVGLFLFVFLSPWMAGTYLLLRLRGVSKPVGKVTIVGRGEEITGVHRFFSPSEQREPYPSASLPGLWDVLNGRMSLVGPRAMSPEEASRLGEWERRRFKAVPGLTGLAQVRSPWTFSAEERMLLDLYYIENWSPLWDIEILMETPAVVFLRFPRRLPSLKKK